MEKHRTGGILEKRSEAKVGDGAQPRTERGTKPSAAYRCRFDFFFGARATEDGTLAVGIPRKQTIGKRREMERKRYYASGGNGRFHKING